MIAPYSSTQILPFVLDHPVNILDGPICYIFECHDGKDELYDQAEDLLVVEDELISVCVLILNEA